MPEKSPFFQRTFDNGLVLLAESMPGVRSCAVNLLIPAGGATDPAGQGGSATVLLELTLRGAGQRDARELSEHLDRLGLVRSSGVSTFHARYTAAALADNVLRGLETYADIVRRPRLEEKHFEPSRDLALQALAGLNDNPQSLTMTRLREQHWAWPVCRNPMGEEHELGALTAEAVRQDHAARYSPREAILSVAGDVDVDRWQREVERLLGDWRPAPAPPVEQRDAPGGVRFIEHKSEQTHIGLACPSTPESEPDYYLARLANEVLSGGMSGRLFTEIREKKGLCYAVYASYNSLPNLASVFAYAGTSNDRAQATLDALLHEMRRICGGVTQDELDRARIGLKAATVMSGESSSARSGALARDWFIRGRLRTLDEILAAIDAVTLDDLNNWLAANPAGPFTIVMTGPQPLTVPD